LNLASFSYRIRGQTKAFAHALTIIGRRGAIVVIHPFGGPAEPQEWNLMPQKVSEIPVDRVKPSSFTLRDLDEAAVEELAGSIRASGLLQPIMVKPTGDGYELVFGLHRLEACKRLGWKKTQPSLSISQARTPS
jgi:uncharacterized ParB-like nuclease family protein